jgi:polyisoprenoid-binding protein YceI
MKSLLKSQIILLLLISLSGFSQKYVTKNGYIRFFSTTPVEDIEAKNKQVNSALDASSGDFVFKVLMKSFEFEKALMQEHFNENYVESDKFPEATFKGKVSNLKDINFSKPGTYKAIVEGDLTIHGVTKKVKSEGTFEVKGDKIVAKSKFFVKPLDYGIKIPKTVMEKIAESLEITVEETLDKLNK